jgi:hypothetical protein
VGFRRIGAVTFVLRLGAPAGFVQQCWLAAFTFAPGATDLKLLGIYYFKQKTEGSNPTIVGKFPGVPAPALRSEAFHKLRKVEPTFASEMQPRTRL